MDDKCFGEARAFVYRVTRVVAMLRMLLYMGLKCLIKLVEM